MGTTDNTAVQTATQNLQNKSLANAATSSGLSGSVGMGARNAPDDVMKVSSALAANGLMEAPQSHADNTLFKGIIGAQEQMDSSLKRDGLVNPGGPTEKTFARLAGQGFVKPVPAQSAAPAASAQPATGDSVLNAEIRADKKQNAVTAAQARVKANLSDHNRSDFRKAQDRHRLEKARDDAERAQGRARHEAAEQRRRNLEQQAAAQRKADAAAEKQAVQARQAVSTGLTKIVSQAGKAIGNAIRDAQQNADAPARHSRVREAGLGQNGNPGLSSADVDSRVRGNDKLVADRNAITLSDDAVASNRRTADALGKVRGVGDLPRFTADAINSGGDKAVYEVADLIGQVRGRDPEQAKELLDLTVSRIGADHRTRLEALFDGRGVEDLHIDGHLRRPETPSDAKWRTMDLRPEDRLDPDNARRGMLYRPEDGEHAVQLREAEAGAGTHPAEDDGSGTPSKPNAVSGDLNSPDDLMLEPDAKYRDPDEWTGKLGETAGDIGGTAADVAKSAWINATGSRQEVKDNLSNLSKEYRAKGYTKAADNLDHFLNGKGKPVTVSRDDARKDPFVRDAELENRKRFELRTFLGDTEDNTDVNDGLRKLKDGETISLKDDWAVRRSGIGVIDDLASLERINRDDALAEGRKDFLSNAEFTATRRGNKVHIKGRVDHDGNEDYDFESGDLGDVMGAKGLADAGLAHNFRTIRKWGQTFEGTVDVTSGSHGNILSNPNIKWIDKVPGK